ncbi:hypothetical protein CS8_090260 [Cupriavidus sp. 8B]
MEWLPEAFDAGYLRIGPTGRKGAIKGEKRFCLLIDSPSRQAAVKRPGAATSRSWHIRPSHVLDRPPGAIYKCALRHTARAAGNHPQRSRRYPECTEARWGCINGTTCAQVTFEPAEEEVRPVRDLVLHVGREPRLVSRQHEQGAAKRG